jgi:hypothetical protein
MILIWCDAVVKFLDAEVYPLIFSRKLMVGTSFSLTVALIIFYFFLIAIKHRNYNKKVSKQQA